MIHRTQTYSLPSIWQGLKILLASVTALCNNVRVPFVKLDTGILDSSLWSEPAQTCKCWITLLAMADATGIVHSTAPGIARRANLGLADTEKALEVFESPDSHSRSLDSEGRRIKRVDGGYQIVNYEKYRERDYTAAERQKRWRDKQKRNAVTPVTRNVTSRKQKQSTEAEAECKGKNPLTIPSLLLRVFGLFRKRTSTPLDDSEQRAWKKAAPIVEQTTSEEWGFLEWAYSQTKGDAFNYRRTGMATLLNNWNSEIEKARRWRNGSHSTNDDRITKQMREAGYYDEK